MKSSSVPLSVTSLDGEEDTFGPKSVDDARMLVAWKGGSEIAEDRADLSCGVHDAGTTQDRRRLWVEDAYQV